MPEKAVMRPLTGAAALHVLLMRISQAQDAYEVFGWTADTVFTMADVKASSAFFDEVMAEKDWRRHPKSVRVALLPIRKGAYRRVIWAIDIVYARLAVMHDLSDAETDVEA